MSGGSVSSRPTTVRHGCQGSPYHGEAMALRLGITTPVVNLNPRFEPPPWEMEGGIDDIAAVVTAADELGYEWAGCPEHVVIPEDIAAVRGGQYWDPVATLGFLAARTSSIG